MPCHHQNRSHSSCNCCSCHRCCCSSPTPAAPPIATDHLPLQALADHLLLLQSPPPPLHVHAQTYLQSSHHHHHHQQRQPQHHGPKHLLQHHSPQQQQKQTQPLIDSLLRRVAALESSLPNLSSTSSSSSSSSSLSSPPPPPPPPSLRDLAARTIQAQFRLFLARRSRTLRHLKLLAAIKSQLPGLRSSLSDRTLFKSLHQSATHLLLQLDSIQSADPMIREGKRSIRRELVQVLEYVGRVLAKDRSFSLGAHPLKGVNDFSRGFDEIGGVSRVCQEDDGMLDLGDVTTYWPSSEPQKRSGLGRDEPVPEEALVGDFGDLRVAGERLSRGVDGRGGFSRVWENEEEAPQEGSDPDPAMGEHPQRQNGGYLGLSAPLPVKMQSNRGRKPQ